MHKSGFKDGSRSSNFPIPKKDCLLFSYRVKAQKQLASQLFPANKCTELSACIWDKSTTMKKWEENISNMRTVIAEHSLFVTELETEETLWLTA